MFHTWRLPLPDSCALVATEQLRGRKNGIFRYLRMGVVAVKLPLLLAAPEPFTQTIDHDTSTVWLGEADT